MEEQSHGSYEAYIKSEWDLSKRGEHSRIAAEAMESDPQKGYKDLREYVTGKDWKIEEVGDLRDNTATFELDSKTIKINRNISDAHKLYALHHEFAFGAATQRASESEDPVTTLGNEVPDLLRDDLELAKLMPTANEEEESAKKKIIKNRDYLYGNAFHLPNHRQSLARRKLEEKGVI